MSFQLLHQMFPAPGVYDALTMLLQSTVCACTFPLNMVIGAFTFTKLAVIVAWLALTVTFAAAFTVTPLLSSLIKLPLLSSILIDPGPSCRVIFWPPGVSAMNFSCPF